MGLMDFLASGEIGIELASIIAPTLLWVQMRFRSLLRPSLKSIIELSLTNDVILSASLTRGVKFRCLPSNAPPSEPVTQIASPTFAPFLRTGGLARWSRKHRDVDYEFTAIRPFRDIAANERAIEFIASHDNA